MTKLISELPPTIPENEDIDFVRAVEAPGTGLEEVTDDTGNKYNEMGESSNNVTGTYGIYIYIIYILYIYIINSLWYFEFVDFI